MKFKWSYNEINDRSVFDQIKRNRHISDTFLNSGFEDIPSPSCMKDMDKAADRIIAAVRQNQKIMIYGHDDVDGITATYILFDFLEKLGFQNHFYYIPNRLLENHGIPLSLVQRLIQDEFNLLVTVDGGISEFSIVDDLSLLGIEVIITDHHIVQNTIPDAYAVVDPKQEDCLYPDDMIAGVTISYFLVQAIAQKLHFEPDNNYLFWVGVGTVADKVPLLGVNRLILKEVLANWFDFDDISLIAMQPYLVAAPNLDKRIGIIKYITRLLSNGRQPFGEHLALNYLLASQEEKAIILQNLVQEQREYDTQLNLTSEYLKETIQLQNENFLIFYDDDNKIDIRFMGVAASQISSKYKIPVVILKKRDDIVTGEARTTKGFCLIKAFHHCRNALIQYGGHSRAAGFTAREEAMEDFRTLFADYVKQNREVIENNKELLIDAVFTIDGIDEFFSYIQSEYQEMQPFGQGNKNPKFLLKNYNPARDWKKLKLKDEVDRLDADKTYEIVFKFKGSFFRLIDYREVAN
ncbi:MAG TPA: DHH family phosphoesterase [Candidatus Cloacimonadota bacterium]|nr:DHH family phosphoesterase [Candidatus Cloacimonadota bacterium]